MLWWSRPFPAGSPLPPTGALWVQGSRSRQDCQHSCHGPSEARKRWALPGLLPGTPGAWVCHSFQSFSSPKSRPLGAHWAYQPIERPALLAPSASSLLATVPSPGLPATRPRNCGDSRRQTGCPLGCGFLHPLHLSNCSLLLGSF